MLTSRATVLVGATFVATCLGCGGAAPAPAAPPEPAATAPEAARTITGKAPAAVNGAPSVVILEPRANTEFPTPSEPVVMDQFSMMFVPAQLLVRTSQPVRFLNSDQELHNVRVVENDTRDTIFNVATVAGGYYEHIFERPGTYAVTCDVHTAMGAVIIVTSTPHAVIADANGTFSLVDVTPGIYTATVYAGEDRLERVVEIADSQAEAVLNLEREG